MSTDDVREPVSQQTDTRGLGAFQFSFVSLFIIMTGVGMVLATFLAIGRLIGMSAIDVVLLGIARMLYMVPVLIIWIVGLVVAARHRKHHPVTANFVIAALAGLILTTIMGQITQMLLVHLNISNRVSAETLSWGFLVLGVFQSLLHAVWWSCLLAAIYRQLSRRAAHQLPSPSGSQ